MPRFLCGLVAGLAATGGMTVWELVFFRRYGLEGCLDWHINQCLLSRLNGREPAANLYLGLGLHAIAGAAAGGAFAVLAHPASLPVAIVAGVGFGLMLWTVLLPFRKIATGLGPREGRLGSLPALVSLVGHVIYGFVLGAMICTLCSQ